MRPKSFEEKISGKFAREGKPAPRGVWTGVENSLNADLVSVYSSQQATYKWISAAAVLIAAFLLGILLTPFASAEQESNTASYNALLSSSWEPYHDFGLPNSARVSTGLAFTPIVSSEENQNIVKVAESFENQAIVDLLAVSSKGNNLDLAVVESDIYRFLSLNFSQQQSRKKSNESSTVWAGVEAGAGTFNADFAGSGALANSFNPAGLASAIGSESFVNPTTSIAQEMEDGVTTSFGIDFGMSLGKKWTLESGLAYTRMDNSGSASINVLDVYTIDNTEFINSTTPSSTSISTTNFTSREASIEVENTYDHEVTLNNTMQFATIPVKAGYFVVDRKVSLRLNAGLSANYLVQGDLSDPSKQILNSDQLNIYNDWSFDGIGGVEIGYSIFNKFDLTLEPNYRHSITPISNSVNSPSRFVVQTGLRYTLK